MNLQQIGEFVINKSWVDRSRENSQDQKNIRRSRDVSQERKQFPSKPNIPTPKQTKNKDSDLLTMMTAKLASTEKTLESYKKELKLKMQQANDLKLENEQLKLLSNKDVRKEMNKLMETNIQQQDQINQMQKFLDQYGLKWQQGKSKENDEKIQKANSDLKQPKQFLQSARFNYQLPKEIDIKIINMRIQELNMVLSQENPTHVVKDEYGVNKIKKCDPLPVGFYRNGVVIKGHPFHLYSSKEGQQILADILEGYFPYQLKKQFPDGVPLKVLDKLNDDWDPNIKPKAIQTLEDIEEQQLKPKSLDQFLNNLPQSVIKDGKIIDIRTDLQKNIKKGENQEFKKQQIEDTSDLVGQVEVPTQIKLKEDRNELSDQEKEDMVILKIRTEKGKRTLIIKMLKQNKINELFKITDKYCESLKYEIFSRVENESYQKDKDMDLECFYPQSALQLKQI